MVVPNLSVLPLLHNNIDQLAGDTDDLDDCLARREFLRTRQLGRELLQCRTVKSRGNLDPVAHLAIDLQDDLYLILHERRRIVLRPRLCVDVSAEVRAKKMRQDDCTEFISASLLAADRKRRR